MDGIDFDWFEYDTAFLPLSPIPRLEGIGEGLKGFLENEYADRERIILVGHSQGGLVIQSFLVHMLDASRGHELTRIANVMVFATPHYGSLIARSIRRAIYRWIPNSQETTLQALNASAADICRRVAKDILFAPAVAENHCPIQFQAFWGESDPVVPEASARGTFYDGQLLPGGHSSVIRPPRGGRSGRTPANDPRYLALRKGVLHPPAHPVFIVVDKFTIRLTVRPGRPGETIRPSRATADIPVRDHAVRRMELQVSPACRAIQPYEIKYRSIEGYVSDLGGSDSNLATSDELYARETGFAPALHFSFLPEPGKTHFHAAEIVNGFSAGNRDWRHHFQRNVRCGIVRLELDLSGYVDAGFQFRHPPNFAYFSGVIEDKSLRAARTFGRSTPLAGGADVPKGIWTLEVPGVRDGVIDVYWRLEGDPAEP